MASISVSIAPRANSPLRYGTTSAGCWRSTAGRISAGITPHASCPSSSGLFERARLEPGAVDGIGVGVGPRLLHGRTRGHGDRTRAGPGWGVPVAGASTLAGIALRGLAPGGRGVAVVDARRGNVYAARFLRPRDPTEVPLDAAGRAPRQASPRGQGSRSVRSRATRASGSLEGVHAGRRPHRRRGRRRGARWRPSTCDAAAAGSARGQRAVRGRPAGGCARPAEAQPPSDAHRRAVYSQVTVGAETLSFSRGWEWACSSDWDRRSGSTWERRPS